MKVQTKIEHWPIVAIMILCAAWNAPASAKEFGYEMKQRHYVYGTMDVLVTTDGVKLKNKDADFAWACLAPKWDLVLYSQSRKLVNKRPYTHWTTKGVRTAISLMNNDGLYNWPRVLVAKKQYHGVDCDVYFFPGKLKNGRAASLKHGKFADMIISPRMGMPAQAGKFLQALYDIPIPYIDGIPFSFNKLAATNSYGFGLKYNKTEMRTEILETLSVKRLTRPVPLALPPFDQYKNAPESDIVVKKGALDDAFSEFMDRDSRSSQ